jgi:hypothetical protein
MRAPGAGTNDSASDKLRLSLLVFSNDGIKALPMMIIYR